MIGCGDPSNRIHPADCLCGDARWAAENHESEDWVSFGAEIRRALDGHGVTDRRIRREVREELQESWRWARRHERGDYGLL